jgi:metal-responsive CopG/Arc/MetJ family transcriptional regulator
MKVKTSVTLSAELLQAIDAMHEAQGNRSDFLEEAAWVYIRELRRRERAKRDIEIIERCAEYLHEEVMDALGYQVGI